MVRWGDQLARLPKAELHLHLRGALPPALLPELVRKYGTAGLVEQASPWLQGLWARAANLRPFLEDRWSAADFERFFEFADFENFLATFAFTGFLMREADDLRALVEGVLRGLREQNVVYAEIMVSLREYLMHGLRLEDCLSIMSEACVPGIRVRWLVDLVRSFGVDAADELLGWLIDANCPAVTGIHLGGPEHLFPPARFEPVFRRARAAGLRVCAHAGEALGPESVRDAVELLAVERVGHGVRAVEDAELVAELARRRVPLEICPTSNRATGVTPRLAAHPLPTLLRAGVAASISTDDPTFFKTSLTEELLTVSGMGVPQAEVLELMRNGFRHAFADAAERDDYVSAFDRELAALAGP